MDWLFREVIDFFVVLMVKVQFDVTFPALACSVLSIDAMDISGEQHLDVVCIIRKTCWFNFVLFQFPAWTLKRSNAYELEQFVMCYLSFVFWCTCSETWYNQEKNRFSWQCDRNKARWNWFSHGKFYGYLSLFWRMYYVIHIFYIGQLISPVIRFAFFSFLVYVSHIVNHLLKFSQAWLAEIIDKICFSFGSEIYEWSHVSSTLRCNSVKFFPILTLY